MKNSDLTKAQRDILEHRLEHFEMLPDFDCEELFSADEETINGIAADMLKDMEWEEVQLKWGTRVTNEVLADCCNGGVWMGAAQGEAEERDLRREDSGGLWLATQQKACDNLAEKVAKFTGLVVEYPDC